MDFISWQFAIFYCIVFAAFYGCRNQRLRQLILFAAGVIFYGFYHWSYVPLLMTVILITYVAGRFMASASDVYKRLALWTSITICLLFLFYFKYCNFSIDLYNRITSGHIQALDIVVPIGISFYIFQALGYVIDVYRSKVTAERNLLQYALFVSFFPGISSGPISRYSGLGTQICNLPQFDYDAAVYGCRQFLWGAFKKIVIADTLAIYADAVFGDVAAYHGLSLLTASVFYTFQIYGDFSGYSDMAIGLARILGFHLDRNFNAPYLSSSVQEFWRRWHISLSSWFRDYVYIPLGGNRKGPARKNINILITFLLSGLWHGANITFVVWGGLHGLVQVMENLLPKENRSNRIYHWMRVAVVFCICSAAWVFFRADSVTDALYVFCHMFDGVGQPLQYIVDGAAQLQMTFVAAGEIVILLVVLIVSDLVSLQEDPCLYLRHWNRWFRYMVYYGMIALILYAQVTRISNPFVYFAF